VSACLVCLDPVPSGDYHTVCLRRLYGSDAAPAIDLSESTLRTVALATLGHSALPGVQPKVSLGLVRDRRMTLRVNVGGRRQYIVKPQTRNVGLDSLPENEHLSMLIARLFGVLTPEFGLIRLNDGGLAYIVERFDRTRDGRKVRQEDFAQLLGVLPAHKYDATGDDCAAVLERYSGRARADLVRLFERYVLAYWIGDGDMHLKNLSLLAGPDDRHSLSPAYDIVCGAVYKDFPQGSALALPLSPTDTRPDRAAWLRFAARCGVPDAAAVAILRRPTERLAAAEGLLERSLLPTRALRSDYRRALRARADALLTDRR
jgi:serine/threonine-protein kinase HipA